MWVGQCPQPRGCMVCPGRRQPLLLCRGGPCEDCSSEQHSGRTLLSRHCAGSLGRYRPLGDKQALSAWTAGWCICVALLQCYQHALDPLLFGSPRRAL